jgi:hypothetical protein
MSKNLKKRKTNRQSITRINTVAQSTVESDPSEKVVISSQSTFSKTNQAISEAERYKYIKRDLKSSLILGLAIFALIVILYFSIR